MKAGQVGAVLLAIGGALSIGWFFDTQLDKVTRSRLDIPENIDYYLRNINYRALDTNGMTQFQLQSPYLEHQVNEDISQIQLPNILFHSKQKPWQATAQHASLQHQLEILELNNEVLLQRLDSVQPLQLKTEVMILEIQTDRVEMPGAVTVNTDKLHLQAANASMDVKNDYFLFNRVKATYQNLDNHEAS